MAIQQSTFGGALVVMLEESGMHQRVLELAWVADVTASQARAGASALVDAIAHLTQPVGVSVRLVSNDGWVGMGLLVSGFDADAAQRATAQVRQLAAACMPWYGLAETAAAGRFAVPARPAWACRIITSDDPPSARVTVAHGAPLASGLAGQDALVSATLGVAFVAGDPQRCADVIVTGTSDVGGLGALVALEVGANGTTTLQYACGDDAARLAAGHGLTRPASLPDEAFAALLSLPARMTDACGWEQLPAAPCRPQQLVEAASDEPELHRWILGRSGTGKTTLLEHLFVEDAAAGKALLLLDPHGELSHRVAALVLASRAGEVTLLDFAQTPPPRYELLRPEDGQTPSMLVNEVVEVIRAIFDEMPPEFFGPVFHRILRWALTLVLAGSDTPNLSEAIRVLQGDSDLVETLLSAADDDQLRRTWEREIRSVLTADADDGASVYVASKLDPFISDAHLAQVFAGSADDREAATSVMAALDRGGIVIVRAPVGTLGLAGARTLCTGILQRVTGGAGARFDASQRATPLAVYIDEWQRVAESTVTRLLAEGRKFGFELTLANQSAGQLSSPATVVANTGTLIAFRVGATEAALVDGEFSRLTGSSLRRLPPHWCAIRTAAGAELIGHTPAPLQPPPHARGDRPTPRLTAVEAGKPDRRRAGFRSPEHAFPQPDEQDRRLTLRELGPAVEEILAAQRQHIEDLGSCPVMGLAADRPGGLFVRWAAESDTEEVRIEVGLGSPHDPASPEPATHALNRLGFLPSASGDRLWCRRLPHTGRSNGRLSDVVRAVLTQLGLDDTSQLRPYADNSLARS